MTANFQLYINGSELNFYTVWTQLWTAKQISCSAKLLINSKTKNIVIKTGKTLEYLTVLCCFIHTGFLCYFFSFFIWTERTAWEVKGVGLSRHTIFDIAQDYSRNNIVRLHTWDWQYAMTLTVRYICWKTKF